MKITGHRGTRGTYIENSLPGFLKSLESECYGIELDINCTKDGFLYVHHDPFLQDKNKKISLYEWQKKDFNNLDLNQYYGPKTTEFVPIPSFSKVLETLKSRCFLLLEIKSNPDWIGKYQPETKVYAATVIEEIKRHQLDENSFMLQSFDPAMLEALHALEPAFNYGFLIETKEVLKQAFNTLSFNPAYFNPEYILLNPEFINEVHSRNAQCYTWTVNELKQAKQLKNMGVDGIITDFPELFQKNIGI